MQRAKVEGRGSHINCKAAASNKGLNGRCSPGHFRLHRLCARDLCFLLILLRNRSRAQFPLNRFHPYLPLAHTSFPHRTMGHPILPTGLVLVPAEAILHRAAPGSPALPHRTFCTSRTIDFLESQAEESQREAPL